MLLLANSVLCNVFSFSWLYNYTSDNMLCTAFIPQCLAVDSVYCLFKNYVGWYVFFFSVLFCYANKSVH